MKSLGIRKRLVGGAAVLLAFPFLTGADGSGCGGTIPVGSGTQPPDGGSSEAGVVACSDSDCTGGVPAIACAQGPTVTTCTRQSSGSCGWQITCPGEDGGHSCGVNDCGTVPPVAPCPGGGGPTVACAGRSDGSCGWQVSACPPADGGSGDGSVCPASACPPAMTTIAELCPDGSSPPAVCMSTASGSCTWQFPPCPSPAPDGGTAQGCKSNADCPSGSQCGFLETAGCGAQGSCFLFSAAPICSLYEAGCACDGSDINIAGCATGLPSGYASKPLASTGTCNAPQDAGTSCASTLGGHCGGNTANPCTCVAPLVCRPGDSGLPFGDVGGTCEP